MPTKTSKKYKRAIEVEQALLREFRIGDRIPAMSEMTVMYDGRFFVAGYVNGEHVVLASGWEGK